MQSPHSPHLAQSPLFPQATQFSKLPQSPQIPPSPSYEGAHIADDHTTRTPKRTWIDQNSTDPIQLSELGVLLKKTTRMSPMISECTQPSRGSDTNTEQQEVRCIALEFYVVFDRQNLECFDDATELAVQLDFDCVANLTSALRENTTIWRFHLISRDHPFRKSLHRDIRHSETDGHLQSVTGRGGWNGFPTLSPCGQLPVSGRATTPPGRKDACAVDGIIYTVTTWVKPFAPKPLNESQAHVRDLILSISDQNDGRTAYPRGYRQERSWSITLSHRSS